MNLVLFDETEARNNLLPFTFTRPVSEVRIGIFTIREKWEQQLSAKASYLTQPYLSKKYPLHETGASIFINGKICPDQSLTVAIKKLQQGQSLYKGSTLIAFAGTSADMAIADRLDKTEYPGTFLEIDHPWDIFRKNGEAIEVDFAWISSQRKSKALSPTVTVIGDKSLVFLEEGALAEACILNTMGGPIYIGKQAEIMEGSAVRGPFALCEHSALKLNTKIYGPSTIGPECKVGGEVNNSVIFGYSNKAHDGFLGNSVIGEWCNLGADTNNSNLKNNYGNVKLYNYPKGQLSDTGLQFCGLMMADHSKCGINTMFNTGTVVGVGANIYGGGFPPTHIKNFSWGGSEGFEDYRLDKLFETAERVFGRRNLKFDQIEKDLLTAVSELKS